MFLKKQILSKLLLFILSGLVIPHCGENLKEKSTLQSWSSIDNPKQDPLNSQIYRYKNQTEFLNKDYKIERFEKRDATHSITDLQANSFLPKEEVPDIIKKGKKGDKILYLLNRYRGLQVISFAEGAQQPRVIGRSYSRGNTPVAMFFHEQYEQLLVVEKVSFIGDEAKRSPTLSCSSLTRLVLFDVENNNQPVMTSAYTVNGDPESFQQLGNSFFLGASLTGMECRDIDPEVNGKLFSFNIGKSKISLVDEIDVTSPVTPNFLEIHKVDEQEGDQYYLASLSYSGGWWWTKQSHITFYKFSHNEAKLHKVFTLRAKGYMDKKSQVIVRNHSVILVSNFVANQKVHPKLKRIAVESFSIKGLQQGDKNPTNQLILSTLTPTDNAELKEVQSLGDQLYIFWSSQNKFNPFEVIDISKPSLSLNHSGQLRFEGVVDHTQVFNYGKRSLILTFGHKEGPCTERRVCQIPELSLLEVSDTGQGLQQKKLSSLTLEQPASRFNFNNFHSTVSLDINQAGQGLALFPLKIKKGRKESSGAKLIGLDLNNPPYLVNGEFLPSSHGWLRRVFHNSEMETIHTFSHESLSTYGGSYKNRWKSSGKFFTKQSDLVLSRNVISYTELINDDDTFGIQIERGSKDPTQTIIRLASKEDNGVHVLQSKSPILLKGFLVDILTNKSKTELKILLEQPSKIQTKKQIYNLITLNLSNPDFNLRITDEIKLVFNKKEETLTYWPHIRTLTITKPTFVTFSNQQIFIKKGLELFEITKGRALPVKVEPLIKDCSKMKLMSFNDQFYLLHYELMTIEAETDSQLSTRGTSLRKYFITPLKRVNDYLETQKSINIPGIPLMWSKNHRILITFDDGEKNLTAPLEHLNINTFDHSHLTLLQLSEGRAILKDLAYNPGLKYENIHVQSDYLMYVNSVLSTHSSQRGLNYTFLKVSKEVQFEQQTFNLPLGIDKGAVLLGVVSDNYVKGSWSVVGNENEVQIIYFSDPNTTPKVMEFNDLLYPANTLNRLKLNNPLQNVKHRIHFSPKHPGFLIAEGLFGVSSFTFL